MDANIAVPAALIADPARDPRTPKAMQIRAARSCYDHLAGRLGVAIAEAMEAHGLLSAPANVSVGRLYGVTEVGWRWFAEQGIDVGTVGPKQRPLARRCLDWTERRHHLAGALGTLLLARFEAMGWVERNRETRAVTVTRAGAEGLKQRLGIEWDMSGARAAA